jgi:hypothetical protein
VARVLQNRSANGDERENGWKEVTEKAGEKGHNSRDLAVRGKGIIKPKKQSPKQIIRRE